MPNSVKSLGYIIAILSDTTVRRSAVDREDLKPNWKSEKRPQFSRRSTIVLFASFSKTITTERRLTGQYFLAVDLSPTFLNTGTTDETFQQFGKQDSCRHLLKSLASMYESSGSKFFRTTTGIQSGPDPFDESRFVMTFLTMLGVMELLCSFRLVLEGKAGHQRDTRVIKIRVLGKVFSKLNCFIRCRRQHIWSV